MIDFKCLQLYIFDYMYNNKFINKIIEKYIKRSARTDFNYFHNIILFVWILDKGPCN